jgi:hypothetical protein
MGQPKRKSNAGRPTVYRKVFAEQATKLCELGATDYELAKFFAVSTITLWRWKLSNEEFCKAVQVGKEKSDDRVKMSLYHRAVGYNFDAEELFSYQGEIIRANTVKHVPPDPGAALNWLKNRRPDEWRERTDTTVNVLISLADLVNSSYRPDLPALAPPKDIENE